MSNPEAEAILPLPEGFYEEEDNPGESLEPTPESEVSEEPPKNAMDVDQ